VRQSVAAGRWRGAANLSVGGSRSEALNAAANDLAAGGAVVAAAGGNSGGDARAASPASAAGALAVAATDAGDRAASFSNRGACVGAWAPGVAIESSSWRGDYSTTTLSGTSMASPAAAGAAALVLGDARYRDATAAQVKAVLLKAAVPLPLAAGTTSAFLQARAARF
jgi:subtilisin family serine protease